MYATSLRKGDFFAFDETVQNVQSYGFLLTHLQALGAKLVQFRSSNIISDEHLSRLPGIYEAIMVSSREKFLLQEKNSNDWPLKPNLPEIPKDIDSEQLRAHLVSIKCGFDVIFGLLKNIELDNRAIHNFHQATKKATLQSERDLLYALNTTSNQISPPLGGAKLFSEAINDLRDEFNKKLAPQTLNYYQTILRYWNESENYKINASESDELTALNEAILGLDARNNKLTEKIEKLEQLEKLYTEQEQQELAKVLDTLRPYVDVLKKRQERLNLIK